MTSGGQKIKVREEPADLVDGRSCMKKIAGIFYKYVIYYKYQVLKNRLFPSDQSRIPNE